MQEEGEKVAMEKTNKIMEWEDSQSAEMLVAIIFWDSILCSSDMYMYLVNTEDCQSPQAWIWRTFAPHAWRKVAPPRLRLCPENFSGENPAFERRDLSFIVKVLYITNFVLFPDL